jgi:hypothetical protein
VPGNQRDSAYASSQTAGPEDYAHDRNNSLNMSRHGSYQGDMSSFDYGQSTGESLFGIGAGAVHHLDVDFDFQNAGITSGGQRRQQALGLCIPQSASQSGQYLSPLSAGESSAHGLYGIDGRLWHSGDAYNASPKRRRMAGPCENYQNTPIAQSSGVHKCEVCGKEKKRECDLR